MNPNRLNLLALVVVLGAASPLVACSTAMDLDTSASSTVQGNRAVAQHAIESYAADYGVSEDVAADRLDTLGKMTSTAQAMQQRPDFGGFQVVTTEAGPEGQLALTSVTAETAGSIHEATGFTLFPARVPAAELLSVSESLVKAAAPITALTAVMYNPFEDSLTAWLPANSPAVSTETERALADAVIAADPRFEPTVMIHIAISEDAEFLAGQCAVQGCDLSAPGR